MYLDKWTLKKSEGRAVTATVDLFVPRGVDPNHHEAESLPPQQVMKATGVVLAQLTLCSCAKPVRKFSYDSDGRAQVHTGTPATVARSAVQLTGRNACRRPVMDPRRCFAWYASNGYLLLYVTLTYRTSIYSNDTLMPLVRALAYILFFD